MKAIKRPLTIGEVGTMLHLAEFMLTQANDILLNITIAPDMVVPLELHKKAERIGDHVRKALEEL